MEASENTNPRPTTRTDFNSSPRVSNGVFWRELSDTWVRGGSREIGVTLVVKFSGREGRVAGWCMCVCVLGVEETSRGWSLAGGRLPCFVVEMATPLYFSHCLTFPFLLPRHLSTLLFLVSTCLSSQPSCLFPFLYFTVIFLFYRHFPLSSTLPFSSVLNYLSAWPPYTTFPLVLLKILILLSFLILPTIFLLWITCSYLSSFILQSLPTSHHIYSFTP